MGNGPPDIYGRSKRAGPIGTQCLVRLQANSVQYLGACPAETYLSEYAFVAFQRTGDHSPRCRVMARFFFDTSIGESPMRDAEGLEYPDAARACRDARRSLAALVAEALGDDAHHMTPHHCAVTVRDSSGQVVARFFASLGEGISSA